MFQKAAKSHPLYLEAFLGPRNYFSVAHAAFFFTVTSWQSPPSWRLRQCSLRTANIKPPLSLPSRLSSRPLLLSISLIYISQSNSFNIRAHKIEGAVILVSRRGYACS
ncbi:uncharacterized protein K444DRAFT_411933 [Hyaloscypha bicolor E]|uniref:Uncharacterized protein n=1 Tax=Hyaloscypha bicolor E TaxID=1095630 RepID=A0A2J6T8T4_9HELO|nr:uncharacterized protein K444DRAFT_411933 [Hyaloscypha bicolor E]PMD59447.1 hypothetical protein K444DRAFT_411933 [Hyaloscypha bicolor E]